MRVLTTLSCHSGSREGSVAYEKTSSGGRAISMLDTIGATVPPRWDAQSIALSASSRVPIADFSFARQRASQTTFGRRPLGREPGVRWREGIPKHGRTPSADPRARSNVNRTNLAKTVIVE